MKRQILSVLLAGVMTSASAQTHVDAQPQTRHTFNLGQRLSLEGFTPANQKAFTPTDTEISLSTINAPIGTVFKKAPMKSAAVHYSYNASGISRDTNALETWTMQAGYLDGQTALQDVIPDGFNAGGIAVPYTTQGNYLVVEPTYLGDASGYHVILFALDNGGSSYDLRIALDGNGAMTVDPNLQIIYGAFTTNYFNADTFQGYFELYSGVNYRKNIVLGDANEDSVVDKADTQTLVSHLLNRSQDNADADAMDTNADGSINVADVIGLSKIIKKQK